MQLSTRLLAILALQGCVPPVSQTNSAATPVVAPVMEEPLAAELDRTVRRHVHQGFSGVVLVGRGSDPIFVHGYGSQQQRPVAAEDRFWLASTGNQFASAAIFKLVEHGKVSLDDPLSRFISSAPADKSAITVRQLLTHTSGLGQSYVSEGLMDRNTAVTRMLSEPLKGPPGTEFRYSNSNTQLASAVVEVASGVFYPEFVTKFLWSRAGLTDTGFAGPHASKTVNPIREGELPPRLKQAYWGEQGVFSTASDLFKWYQALRSGTVLSERSVDMMFAPAVKIGEGYTTPGWFRGSTQRGTEYVFVRGNEDLGANTLLYSYPARGVVVVVLTHSGDADDETSWSRRVLRDIEQALRL